MTKKIKNTEFEDESTISRCRKYSRCREHIKRSEVPNNDSNHSKKVAMGDSFELFGLSIPLENSINKNIPDLPLDSRCNSSGYSY